MKIPNGSRNDPAGLVSLARIVSEDSQPELVGSALQSKSSKDS